MALPGFLLVSLCVLLPICRAHDEQARWVQSSADVSALAVSRGILMIGTEGGSLLLFDIVPRDKDSLTSGSVFRPQFVGCEHIGRGPINCLIPIERDIAFAEAFGVPVEKATSSTDLPLRILSSSCVVGAAVDPLPQASPAQSSTKAKRRSRAEPDMLDVGLRRTSLSCWEFRSPQDHDRFQRLRLYHQLLSNPEHRQPFHFPKLTVRRVCPTAVVKVSLDD